MMFSTAENSYRDTWAKQGGAISRSATADWRPRFLGLFLAVNRAGAGDVFFNRRIAGIADFSRAGNGDFQRFGNCDFCVACAGRGDFGGLGVEAACVQLASPGHISKEFIDVSIERNM